ncbi:MAG: response regulator [Leptospiraceae bacterium]|nr:response regulator [Leptospiraceae bacterium]
MHNLNDLNILYVEDSKATAMLIKKIVESKGAVCQIARNGEEALPLLSKEHFDLILIDYDLPDVTGLDLIRWVVARQMDTPCVMLTAVGDEEIAFQAMQEGAYDFVLKSSNVQNINLIDLTILKALERQKLIREKNKAYESLKKSEEDYRTLVQILPDIVFKIDSDGMFTFLNDAVRELGYEPSSLIGRHFSVLLHPDDAAKVDRHKVLPEFKGRITGPEGAPKLFNERRTGDRSTRFLEVRLRDNQKMMASPAARFGLISSWGEVSVTGQIQTTGSDLSYPGSAGIIRNITVRKENERLLIEAKQKAEEADRLKSIFLANMSHEIRTPMNAIIGYTDLLIDLRPDLKQREYLDIIKDSGSMLLNLINNILDLSRMESDQMQIVNKSVDLHALLQSVYSNIAILIRKQARNIELEVQLPAAVPRFVRTDAFRLKQVLMNLLGNAVKFTESGSISFGIEMVADDMLQFHVRDTGQGIADSDLENIFDPFRQFHQNAQKYGGTGLGLAICKNIVELMQGHIWCESSTGLESGTTFYFQLPCLESSHALLPQAEPDRQKFWLAGHKVLVADDNPVNQLLAQRILESVAIQVTTADNGQSCFQKYLADPEIELILMDLQMPEMSGIEVTSRIRSHEQSSGRSKTLILALTAVSMAEEKDRCLAAGFDDFLTKPIDKAHLLDTLQRLLSAGEATG